MADDLEKSIANLIKQHGWDAVFEAVKGARPKKNPGRKRGDVARGRLKEDAYIFAVMSAKIRDMKAKGKKENKTEAAKFTLLQSKKQWPAFYKKFNNHQKILRRWNELNNPNLQKNRPATDYLDRVLAVHDDVIERFGLTGMPHEQAAAIQEQHDYLRQKKSLAKNKNKMPNDP